MDRWSDRAAARFLAPTAWVLGATLALGAALFPQRSHAEDDEAERPWGKRTTSFGLGVGPAGNRDLTLLAASLSADYYLLNGLAVGARLTGTYLIWRPSMRSEYPGLTDTVPSTGLRVAPTLRLVPFRNLRFSPYILGAVGPTFLNHGADTLGYWTAEPGA